MERSERAGKEVPRLAEEQWQCWEGRDTSLNVTLWQWKDAGDEDAAESCGEEEPVVLAVSP